MMAAEGAEASRRGAGFRLALGVGLVLMVAFLLVPTLPGDRSSRDYGPGGSAALAGVLGRMGVEVESMRVGLRPLAERPIGSVLVVVLAPGLLQGQAFTPPEITWVRDFVRAGSTLIVVADREHPLLSTFGIRYLWEELDEDYSEAEHRFRGIAVLPEAHTLVGPLSLVGRGGLAVEGSGADILFAVGSTAVVARKRIGAGSAVAVSDPFTISNEGLGEAANLAFYSGLIGDSLSGDGIVMFDDLHAGAETGRGVVAYARTMGFLPALLLILLLAVFYLWRAGSRLGVVLPAVDRRSSRASIEMAHAVGSLYDRAGLMHHALDVLAARLRGRVERRAGLDWQGSPMADWIERELGAQALGEVRWLQGRFVELRGTQNPPLEEVLSWARRAQEFQMRWLVQSARVRETSEVEDVRV